MFDADVDAWYGLGEEKRAQMGGVNHDYLAEGLRDPRTVLAMLEDYRAGRSRDRARDPVTGFVTGAAASPRTAARGSRWRPR